MNYYNDLFIEELGRLGRISRQAQHEASLNTLETIRTLYKDLERNGQFDYDAAMLVIERLEDIHAEAMEDEYK